MIKYNYKLKYMDEFNMVVLDFDEEKTLEFASMISDPLGSDIPWRFEDLKKDIENYMDLLRGGYRNIDMEEMHPALYHVKTIQ